MSLRVDTIPDKALQSGQAERAELAERILASFDPEVRTKIDCLWAAECEGRIAAYDRGELQSYPEIEVAAEMGRIPRRV